MGCVRHLSPCGAIPHTRRQSARAHARPLSRWVRGYSRSGGPRHASPPDHELQRAVGTHHDGSAHRAAGSRRADAALGDVDTMQIGRTYDATVGTGFIDPKTLARIDNLELVARTVVEGFINGLHRSPNLGASMDFAEHRAYMPGDDLRRIDWRLFGRSDKFFVKEFEADTNTNLLLVLDVSASMSFGSTGLSKLQYAKYLASCLGYFSSRQRDRIGLVTFANGIVDYVPPAAKHLSIVLQTIARATPKAQGTLDAPLRQISEHARRRQIVVIIS